MRRILIPVLLGLLLALSGCKKEMPREEAAASSSAPARAPGAKAAASPQAMNSLGYLGKADTPAKPSAPPTPNRSPAIPRKLIRTVDLLLAVQDSAAVARQIESLVTRAGGYVSASSAERLSDRFNYSLTLRVPVD